MDNHYTNQNQGTIDELLDAARAALELLYIIANRAGSMTQSTDMDTRRTRAMLESAIARAKGE
jgi:hypothetical protein